MLDNVRNHLQKRFMTIGAVFQVMIFLLVGNLSAWSATGLNGIVVELRDQTGRVIQTAFTQPDASGVDGSYIFSGFGTACDPPASCYVSVAADRNQVAAPTQSPVNSGSPPVDFNIKGVPAIIHVTGNSPGTFVLVTLTAHTSTTPPQIDQTSGSPNTAYSGVIGLDNQVNIPVPTAPYFLTCWTPNPTGGYVKGTNISIHSGASLDPTKIISCTCLACL